MFPGSAVCYERKYGAGHVRLHPEQRVTRIAVYPDPVRNAPRFAVELRLGVRGISAGATGVAFEVHAVCANDGASTMYCAMEGDAGGGQITPKPLDPAYGWQPGDKLRERGGLRHAGARVRR